MKRKKYTHIEILQAVYYGVNQTCLVKCPHIGHMLVGSIECKNCEYFASSWEDMVECFYKYRDKE